MELDARALPDGSVLEASVCVVGGGPAGLTVAGVLARSGATVLLLESGGRDRDPGPQLLNDGTTDGDPYVGLRATRHRQLGGTAHVWNTPFRGGPGAKYVPLDPVDFQGRSADDLPGWPIALDDLLPFYHQAQAMCELGPFAYRGDEWPGLADRLGLTDPRFSAGVYQLGSSRWCRESMPQELIDHERCNVVHHATVTELRLDSAGERVHEVLVTAVPRRTVRCRANLVVLAAGAIENARMLLHTESLRRRSEWIGRCFMEHPRDRGLTLTLATPAGHERLAFFDTHDVSGSVVAGRLALATEDASRAGMPNASISLFPLVKRTGLAGLIARWRRVPAAEGYGWARSGDPANQYDAFRLIVNLEQRPHRDNRVTLSDQRDGFGVPRPHLTWRWREADHTGLDKARSAIASVFERHRLGRVTVDRSVPIDPNAHHHAGTTRMAGDPRYGVVDADGRVFGTENLFVTGASVFPTAGYANPTLTIVAIALRLAEHLQARA